MDNFAILIQSYAQPSKHGSHQIHTTGYLKSGLKINGIVLKIELEMFENAKCLKCLKCKIFILCPNVAPLICMHTNKRQTYSSCAVNQTWLFSHYSTDSASILMEFRYYWIN